MIDELAPGPATSSSTSSATGRSTAPTSTQRLRTRGVRSLVVTGTVTQICVEETAREAFHHGYTTTVVADAVSSYAPDLHVATLATSR